MGIVPGFGRIAQLVQSACLTRRMSGVRIPLRPFIPAILSGAAGPSWPSCRGDSGMYLSRLIVLGLFAGLFAAPLAAQGIPRGARTTQRAANAPRLMVANPFAFAPGDSAAAVRIGSAVRNEMKDIVGRNFTVV